MNTTAKSFDFSLENAWVSEPATSRIAANNSLTDAGTLLELAQHQDYYVRRNVASNTSTPAAALASLHNDIEEQVRFYLAANPHTPVETLEILARDTSEDVRSQVAGNRQTPVTVLEQLAQDSYTETLRQLAENSHTPIPILVKIGENMLELAKLRAISSDEAAVLRSVAINPRTPNGILEQICAIANSDNHYWVLPLGVVQNPNIDANLLAKLANHDDMEVRIAVAHHRNTPVEILDQLKQDCEYPVRKAVNERFSQTY